MKRTTLIAATILVLVALLPVTPAHAAGTWYVSGVLGADIKACNTPATACKTINAAIVKALPGDTIKVTAGIYLNPGAPEVVNVTKDLTLWGGWNSNFTSTGTYTILDGQYLRRGLSVAAGADLQLINFALAVGLASQGGGAYLRGNLTGNHVLVALNRASYGAGFFVEPGSQLYLISQSAIWANEYYSNGGGIYLDGGFAQLTNTTVSSNSSITSVDEEHGTAPSLGGGVYLTNNATLGTTFATFADNTVFDGHGFTWWAADIANAGGHPVEVDSTLISDGCSGPVNSWGYNIERANTCQLTMPGDLPNTNPLIHSAQNFGTDTIVHPLAVNSPAIDAAPSDNCSSIAIDQRVVARPQGSTCDIGAFERQAHEAQMDVIGDCPPDPAGQVPEGSCPPDAAVLLLKLLGPGAVRALEEGVQAYADSGEIAAQMRKPLVRKLKNAAESLANGSTDEASDQLNAFINQVEAQRGKKIGQVAADNMIEQAQSLIAFLSDTRQDCTSAIFGEDGQASCNNETVE